MTSALVPDSPAQPVADVSSSWLRFVLPLLLISALIAAVGVVGYRYLSEEIRRETDRTLAVIAEQKRQQIEDLIAEAKIDAELYFSPHSQVSTLFGPWLAGGRRDEALMRRMRVFIEDVARVRGWGGLAVFDAEGRPVLVLGEVDAAGHAALIRDVVARPRIELVDLHGAASGAHYSVVAPIRGEGAAPLGVAYLTWRADQALYPQVESWPVPTRTAETYLVRRDGDGVRFLTPLRHERDAALALARPLGTPDLPAARAARGERGILAGGRDYRDVPVLAYAAAVAGTPWLMIAEIDEREAYAGVRTISWATTLVMGLGLLWRRGRQRREIAAAQARRAAEARFRVVFEQAPLGVALLDSRSGCITEANQRFADITGLSPQALAGLDPMQITHPDDVGESREQIARLGAGQSPGYRLSKRYLRPDGSVVWASVTLAPVQVDTEAAPRYLAIVEDISERKRYEHELQQASAAARAANEAKSEFLAHMSHEIRTPMNAVLGLAQVLAREPLADDQRDMVERIRSAGQSLLAILNDVLDLSKIEAGQLRIEPRPFDLGRLLANLDSLMGRAARAKGLALRIEAPAAPTGPLLGDGLRLEQVLFNLTGNAIKFTERGKVTVRVQARETSQRSGEAGGEGSVRLRFEVRDTGIGIAPEALARLFAPFAQADAGIARRFGGTGLGLSICKRLVALMGGEIGADSQPGQGSTFWFELPLQRAGEGALDALAARPAPAPSGPRLVGAHLLVVDDSAMNRDLVERALRLEGAAATLAADGQQAVQLLKARPERFDAVLMDVQMPVMDGLTAMRLIRGELGLIDLPIVAFTAGVRDEQQAAALAAGANDVLAKPMDLDQMAVLLAKWIRPRVNEHEAVLEATAGDRPARAAHAADEGDAFPDIPGIDRERAAQRLSRDRAMFLSLLQMFVEDNAEAADLARRELARGARELAARRMHTLASNAGFLCALELMEAARKLEQAIERGENALDAQLAALGRRIADLVEASAPWR